SNILGTICHNHQRNRRCHPLTSKHVFTLQLLIHGKVLRQRTIATSKRLSVYK
ncbi:hypothetical protein KUCAC02_005822, partial [Chaenocephalus aceratus]